MERRDAHCIRKRVDNQESESKRKKGIAKPMSKDKNDVREKDWRREEEMDRKLQRNRLYR